MVLSIIAFSITGFALLIAGVLLARHWKEIRLLDPLSLKEEQQRRKRDDMIERRFDRIRADQIQPFKRAARKFKHVASALYKKTYERLQAFERLYRTVKTPLTALAPSNRERIDTLLREARSLMRDLKWADAERRYLEILSINAHHTESYKGLGQIYLKQRLYPQANETFDFLIKIKKADGDVYAALAEIAEAEGRPMEAEKMYLKAVESSPRLAHRHAELANFYLSQNHPSKAWPSAKRASDLESKSLKYLELSLETAILLGDRNEAQKRFQRWRLLTDDRSKLQMWKNKMETMGATMTKKGV